MVTTTYGTWCTRVDHLNLSVAGSVSDAFGSEGSEGFDFEAIVEEYREAINEALPPSVSLCGDEFIGPYYDDDKDFEGYPHTLLGVLDIKAIVEDIDLWAIVAKHQEAQHGPRSWTPEERGEYGAMYGTEEPFMNTEEGQ